jgi:AraC-like DNA-binding protein
VLRQSGSASLYNESLPNAVISGLQPRARIVEHGADSSLAIIRFTEVGASVILRDRVDQLYNRTAPLDSVLPRQEIDDLQNVLTDMRELPQRFLAVERFLTGRIGSRKEFSSQAVFPQIEAATEMIRRSEGRSSIAAIARHAAMSQSALERHFRVAVGVTPKKLSRVVRLQHVCRLWHAGKALTEIAFEAGYCDQPHMVRDFRLFTGTSPEEFFRSAPATNLPIFYK